MQREERKPTGPIFAYSMLLYLLLVGVHSVLAQGTIHFANFTAPVFHTDCETRLEGDEFLAGLYAGPLGSSESALVLIESPLGFLMGEGAGHFFGGNIRIPFIPQGEEAAVQVRVWETQAGSFEAARAGLGLYGMSQVLTLQTGTSGEPGGVGFLTGLESFCLIPEPSTQWLFGAGGAFLLGWCLRKNRKGKLAESRA